MKPIRPLKRRQTAIASPSKAYVAAAGRFTLIALFGLAVGALFAFWWLGY
jgi:hypothetical protein